MLNLMILQHCKLLHDKVSLVDNSVFFAWETWGWNGQEEKRGWSVCSNSFTHEGQWRAGMAVAQFLNCHYDIHDFAVIQFYMFKVVHLVWTFWTFSTASRS